ncbi:hypothetical protein EMCRGX_G006625, partial [Ephydatia muelleri]
RFTRGKVQHTQWLRQLHFCTKIGLSQHTHTLAINTMIYDAILLVALKSYYNDLLINATGYELTFNNFIKPSAVIRLWSFIKPSAVIRLWSFIKPSAVIRLWSFIKPSAVIR